MANGIDSIYDPSDVSRMLAELREQRLQMEEAKAKKVKGTTTVGTKAWEMWSREQTAKTREFIGSKDYMYDPKYTDKNWLSRSFTPASKRVTPISDRAISLDKYKSLTGQGGVSGVKGDAPAKFGLKEAGAGIGAGLSLYETISSWDEHEKNKNLKRGIDVGKTLAYTASAVPGPHQAITAPIALGLSLADLFI
jgi:hypothetical protein